MTTNKSSQIATEPNAINVRVEQDFGWLIPNNSKFTKLFGKDVTDFIQGIASPLDNHSKFKNPESVKILQKAMQEHRK